MAHSTVNDYAAGVVLIGNAIDAGSHSQLGGWPGRLCPKLIVSGCHVRPFSVLDFLWRHPHMGDGVQ